MQHWVTSVLEELGYIGVFFMMALENIFPPIPSEIVLPFGGFLTTTTDLSVVGVIVAATVGSVLGAVILFGIGLLLDVKHLEKIIHRYGSMLRIKKQDIQRADAWFDKYGYWTVFICRMVPLVRSLISIPAGMSNMNFVMFLFLTVAGTLSWNTLLILIGVQLGESWTNILSFMELYSTVIYICIGVGIGIIVYLYIKRRRQQ
ncbi:DedA family protein [Virgibacillus chiguensis]|uniref:Membrane protein DedA, SNARE-associated domain n=1 Tax=Virgibacillus chiguensis TaxID=411959 RepID=A0A1M5S745_9BACI|nr:DedA family protein [Virgibacillus chiguensis]SHH34265.1 membrane protein DedA, SNARE-associated domain [Virgibacillus chiguensis]